MSDTRNIKAGDGRRVRHPGGQLLREGGEAVAWTTYWHRLLQDGDVVEVDEIDEVTAPQTPKASADKPAPATDAPKPAEAPKVS